jgi:Lon protease-like protein
VGVLLIAVALGLLLTSPSPAHAGVGEGLQTIVLQNNSAPADAKPLPPEIPLFPLPEVSLFPGVSRPFLIFEPRYRDMIADALAGDRIIGMVALRPGFEKDYEGRPPIYEVGCAGRIQEYEKLADGRYVILLRGLTTFRIAREDQRKPYRLARVEEVPELLQNEERGQLSTLRERLTQLLYVSLPLGVEPPDPDLDDAEFVNVTALNLSMSEAERQQLLERSSVLARARALVERLDRK